MTTRASLPPLLCVLLAHGCTLDESASLPLGTATTHAISSQSSDSGTSTTLHEDPSSDDTTSSSDTSASVMTTTETGAIDTSTSDTTSDPSPVCGNALLEPDEECDDGDLSDSGTDARDRFKGRGRIVLMNGIVFADSWSALLAGELHGPLEVTEESETYHGKVWTGTSPAGTAVPDSTHCADWSTNSALDSAYYGYSDEISGEWLLADQLDNPAECPAPLAIYCFETS